MEQIMNSFYSILTVTLFLGIFPLTTLPVLAQADSTDSDENFHFNMKIEMNPALSLHYGMVQPSLDGLVQSYGKAGIMELKLGSLKFTDRYPDAGVGKFNYRYLTVAHASKDLGGSVADTDLVPTFWRFGMGSQKGYGYILGSSVDGAAIVLTYGDGLQWTRMKLETTSRVTKDVELLELWNKAFRFGSNMESGVNVHISPLLSVNATYERTVAFRRHLFWRWLGSEVLEGIGQEAVNGFVKWIGNSSPGAVPIVHFVLKSAVGYAMYELRKKEMNWPFGGEAPLMIDAFKAGVTFSF